VSQGKHTPWPLVARKGVDPDDEYRCGVCAVRDGLEYHVATIENGAPGDSCDTEFSNAVLFAAAPDMLAALHGLAGILATAESNASGNPEWEHVSAKVKAARAAIAKAVQS